jgi:hypothetical protein
MMRYFSSLLATISPTYSMQQPWTGGRQKRKFLHVMLPCKKGDDSQAADIKKKKLVIGAWADRKKKRIKELELSAWKRQYQIVTFICVD